MNQPKCLEDLEIEQEKLVELEKVLDRVEDNQGSDAFIMIRMGLCMLQTSFAELVRLIKCNQKLNKEEAVLMMETVKESRMFVEMHKSALSAGVKR